MYLVSTLRATPSHMHTRIALTLYPPLLHALASCLHTPMYVPCTSTACNSLPHMHTHCTYLVSPARTSQRTHLVLAPCAIASCMQCNPTTHTHTSRCTHLPFLPILLSHCTCSMMHPRSCPNTCAGPPVLAPQHMYAALLSPMLVLSVRVPLGPCILLCSPGSRADVCRLCAPPPLYQHAGYRPLRCNCVAFPSPAPTRTTCTHHNAHTPARYCLCQSSVHVSGCARLAFLQRLLLHCTCATMCSRSCPDTCAGSPVLAPRYAYVALLLPAPVLHACIIPPLPHLARHRLVIHTGALCSDRTTRLLHTSSSVHRTAWL
jgi:hypothetical protein